MSQASLMHAGVSIATPHGLDQILAAFGDIFACIRGDHTLDPRWQTEQLATVSLHVSYRSLLGPLAPSGEHDLSQATEAYLRGSVSIDIESWAGVEDHQLRRVLLVSSAAHGNKTVDTFLGNCRRSESRVERAGHPRQYECRSNCNLQGVGFCMGWRVARKSARCHALSVLHRVLSAGRYTPKEKAARRRPLPQRIGLKSGLNLKAPRLEQRLRDVLRILVSPRPLAQTGGTQVLIRSELVLLYDLLKFGHGGDNGPDRLRFSPIWIASSFRHELLASVAISMNI